MLLLHQTGSVKIGEVVRYTVTYTPSQDRILPSPERLYVRIRNASSIALRAAFVHGPYTLCVSAYPAAFNPNDKFNNPRRYGVPEFEPMVKAGGSWECELVVPDDIRQTAGTGSHGGFGKEPEHDAESASWVIEVSSQVIFSTSAAVAYEILVARDPKSLNLNSAAPVVAGQTQVPLPGKLSDYQQSAGSKDAHPATHLRGIFSRAIQIKVEDTATLWNTPRLPAWGDAGDKKAEGRQGAEKPIGSAAKTADPEARGGAAPRKQKKIHLVILTHGLHSNLGADMLYMKESIDAAAKQAKIDAKARLAERRAEKTPTDNTTSEAGEEKGENKAEEEDHADDEDDEEVIVRGYSGNATKTEKGIKYLGKRLARYVLSTTYPDQPFLPLGKGAVESFTQGLGDQNTPDLLQAHKHSTILKADTDRTNDKNKRPYRVTSISFIGHSLGGLVQTYAVAYIQKHSPNFFDIIKPINFIALASPFLGLSNENPLYVKFALDFGLVGRTGKDLGLTWRAPTIARSGWGAIVSNLGETAHKKVYGDSQPESKPLLRILPTGPAHSALKKFRNRTVYSNVVNDGIVPLRTSCLLFLDWQGLGRVGKARRDAGLVETMVGFGWAELTGANMGSRPRLQIPSDDTQTDSGATTPIHDRHQVPQPSSDALAEDDRASIHAAYADEPLSSTSETVTIHTPLTGFFNLFRSNEPPKEQPVTEKQKRILRRSQTLKPDDTSSTPGSSTSSETVNSKQPAKATSGHEFENDVDGVMAPPRTTFFESAGDLLNPKIPDVEYLLDPSKRPRTIFHDRVYHPSDIPPPPLKKRASTLSKMKLRSPTFGSFPLSESGSSSPYSSIHHEDSMSSAKDYDDTTNTGPDKNHNEVVDGSSMRVEEKIARGYHRDLSWRKVLVKLEPDAHNNIIVRRMFANAYGWPVVKHLVDAHFSDSAISRMRTEDEHIGELARDIHQPPDEHGGETKAVSPSQAQSLGLEPMPTNASEAREALDEVPDLPKTHDTDFSSSIHHGERADSMSWSERDWIDSDNESDHEFVVESGRDEDKKLDKPKENTGRLSPSWNWAEKIVGKGAVKSRSKSPTIKAKQH